MYKKIQSPYRTRKILPCKAPPILPMEWWRWHNINIPELSRLIHSKQHIIHQNAQKFNEDCVAFGIDIQDLEHNISKSAWEMVALNIVHDNRTTNVTGSYTIQNEEVTEDATHEESHENTRNTTDTLCMLYAKAAKKQDMNLHSYCTYIQNLNTEQCHIVMYNRAWCKSYISAVRHGRKPKRIQNISQWSRGYMQKSCCTSDTKRHVTFFWNTQWSLMMINLWSS